MRYCLSRHSNIYIAPETNFFISIYGSRALIPESQLGERAQQLVDYLFRSGDPSMQEFQGMKLGLIRDIRANVRCYKDLADCILSSFARHQGKVRWGEKTPLHIHYVDEIRRFYPEAKIICMTRAPKNVIASYVKSSHMNANLAYAVAETRACLNAIRDRSVELYVVQYEDLLDDPEAVLRGVASYVGEEYQGEMLMPRMRDSSYARSAMEFDSSIGIEKRSDEGTKWMTVLGASQAHVVDRYLEKGAWILFDRTCDKRLTASFLWRSWLYSLNKKKNRWGLFYWRDYLQCRLLRRRSMSAQRHPH